MEEELLGRRATASPTRTPHKTWGKIMKNIKIVFKNHDNDAKYKNVKKDEKRKSERTRNWWKIMKMMNNHENGEKR